MTSNRPDHELEELLRVVRARYISRSDASFDIDAGLTDVRERAELPFARVPASRIGGSPGPFAAAVALACERVEEFVMALGCVLLEGPLPELVGSEVQRAAEVLLGLRDEIATGSASLAGTAAAVSGVRDALGQADLILRVELGISLDDVVLGVGEGDAGQDRELDMASWLGRLSHEVAAALPAQAQDPATELAWHRRPAPARHPRGGQSRGRRAGGC